MNRLTRIWKRRFWIHALRKLHPEVEVRIGDRRSMVDLRDTVIGSLLYLEHEYESRLEQFMTAIDLDGAVCVDAGANIGLHTTLLSRLVGSKGRVFAFEPEPANFRLLERNLALNHCKNVTAIQAAVGDRAGCCRLALNGTNFGDHRVSRESSQNSTVVVVPVTTIDEALKDVPSRAVKLIKVDVQGYESFVLKGMTETLSRNPDAILMMEVFPEGLAEAGSSASDLIGQLLDLGLRGWEFHDFRLVPILDPWAYDLIRGGKYLDVIVSKNHRHLTSLLEGFYGQGLGPREASSCTVVPA